MEAKLQSEIIKWLKTQGAYVIKTRGGPGVPVGCPDILFVYGQQWGAIEVKASAKAPFRLGQKATLEHLKKWNTLVYVAYPGGWPQIKQELMVRIF